MSEMNNLGPILKAKFEKFCTAKGYEKNGEGFEKFVNHVILNSFQPNAFVDPELFEFVCVGGDNDLGIDGLGILVNGRLVKTIEDIDDILKFSPKIKVDIIFIQSKYREDGISKDFFNNFTFGVREFLSEEIKSPYNESIENYFLLKNHIFSIDVSEKLEENPKIWLYFVAFTDRKASQHVTAIENKFIEDIERLNSYEKPIVKFVDINGLKRIYDESENLFEISINVDQMLPLSSVDGVDDSAILFCYGSEYIKILGSEDDLIRKALFEDNVRDFQGLSGVNQEISRTIKHEPELFALLNNGITIVCDEFHSRNKTIKIKNPQIINGCQSSHVIFNEKLSNKLEKLPLVIKIISTTNLDVVNKIVRAANRQNIVYEEAFETTREFHKTLEEFFTSMNGSEKIYYERRVKQYLNNPQVKSFQKFGIKIVTQAYVGAYLEEVHQAHRHETVLIKNYQGQIFEDSHSYYPYYVLTYAYYRLENLIRNNLIKLDKYYSYRYHLILICKYVVFNELVMKSEIIDISSDEFYKSFLKALNNVDSSQTLFHKSLDLMNKAVNSWVNELGKSKFAIKDNKEFTIHLLKNIKLDSSILNSSLYTGKIANIITKNGNTFGFINYGNDQSIYFDNRSVANDIILDSKLKRKKVHFSVSQTTTGKTFAKNIIFLNLNDY
ncbi:AIPR family protein [Acinetobacter johnsonii]|uniref:AIPR family protein n=1 Tax=Acinetobacter johnsonii TaxID=40214 RepID=UPI003D1702BD